MQGGEDPYDRIGKCPCAPNKNDQYYGPISCIPPGLVSSNTTTSSSMVCKNECSTLNNNKTAMIHSRFCVARARFHLHLASLGKTNLTHEERQWLGHQDDIDGGNRLFENWKIKNPVFLYDQTQLSEDYLWKDLAAFMGLSNLPNSYRKNSHGRNRTIIQKPDLCHPKYDVFRAKELMPYSYQLSIWLKQYLLPSVRSPAESNVVVAGFHHNEATSTGDLATPFEAIVESYKIDPCQRLVLVTKPSKDFKNGTGIEFYYKLDSSLIE